MDEFDGRLEICVRGEWGTVCNDGISDHDGFDIDAARVVCWQLGIQGDEGQFAWLLELASPLHHHIRCLLDTSA